MMVLSFLNQNVVAQNTNLSLFSLSERLGKVAHNFAVERGLTAGFINSKNENDANSALSLMKQCNQMSEDTAGVVNENQSMMDHLFKSINSISQMVEQVATAVEEQSQTTKDINQNIQYINELSHHITEVVNQMNDSVKDSSKRAADVLDEINSYRR